MAAESQIQEIVEFLKNSAPDGWNELRMRCNYYDDAMEIKTHFRRAGEDDWTSYDFGGFDLLDLCEALAAATHPGMDEPWTQVVMMLKADGSHEIEYGYGDPGMFQS